MPGQAQVAENATLRLTSDPLKLFGVLSLGLVARQQQLENLNRSCEQLKRQKIELEKKTEQQQQEITQNQQELKRETQRCQSLEKRLAVKDNLEKELRYTQALADVAYECLSAKGLTEITDHVVKQIKKTLSTDFVSILELSPNQSSFWLRAGIGWQKRMVGLARVEASVNSEPGYTLNHRQTVIIEDLIVETRFRGSPLLHNHRVVSGLCVPIIVAERSFGVLGVYSKQRRSFSEKDINFLVRVTDILTKALLKHQDAERLRLLERAVNASNNGVVIADALQSNLPIIYINTGFERMTGYSSPEVIGLNCNFLQRDDRQQAEIEQLRQAKKKKKEVQITLRNYRKDGSLFWNQLHISPVYDEEQHLTHYIGIQTDVTHDKLTQDILKLTQFSLEHAQESVFWISPEGKIFYVNQTACDFLGYSREELLSLKIEDICQGVSKETWSGFWQKVKHQGSVRVESLHKTKDGRTFPVDAIANYLEFNDQAYICALIRDITEQKQTEKALQESEEKFRKTFEQAAVGMAQVDLEGKFIKVNLGLSRILGYEVSELIGKRFSEISFPEEQALDQRLIEQILTGELPNFSREKRYVCKDGSLIWGHINVSLLRDNANQPKYFIAVLIDINHRKRAEQERDRFFTLSLDLLCIADFNGYYRRINPAFENTLGYSRNQLLAQPFLDFIHPEDQKITEEKLWQLIRGENLLGFENRHRCADGSYRWLSWSSVSYPQEGLIYAVAHDITKRKEVEAEVRNTRQFLQTMIDHLPLSVYVKDGRAESFGKILLWNKACEQMFGVTAPEAIGKTLYDYYPTAKAKEWQEQDRQTLKAGIPQEIAAEPLESPHLGSRLVRIVKIPLYDAQQQPEYLLCICEDITSKKQAEQALRESRARLDSILASLTDIVWSVDFKTGEYLYLNEVSEQIYGRPLSEFSENTNLWLEVVHPEDLAKLKAASTRLNQEHIPKDLEYRIIRPDGEIRWIRDRAKVIYDENNSPIRIDGIAVDITESKKAQIALQASEERLREIISTISDSLVVVNQTGKIKFVNPAAEKLFGRNQFELINHLFGIPFVEGQTTEITIHPPDNGIIIAEMRIGQIVWEEQPAHLVSLRDITERYQAQKALEASEEKYRQIVETAAEGIWLLNQNNKTIFVNHQLSEMLGYSANEMMDKSLFDFMDSEAHLMAQESLKRRRQGVRETHDFKFRRRDGTDLWAIVSATPLLDEDGNYQGALGMITDITDRKNIEQALSESEQRLESILNSIQDVVWSVSPTNGSLIYLNPATEIVYGIPVQKLLAQKVL